METRLALLSDYVAFAEDLASYYVDEAQKSSEETYKSRQTYIAYSLLSISPVAELVIRGVGEKNNLLVFSGLRMLEENHANIVYVFRDSQKVDGYISKILKRGIEYQQAFTEIRNNPELGMAHLAAVGRWSKSTITQRIKSLGEGPEFRYEMACKYLHSDIWTLLNNHAVKDLDGLMYGQISWAIEDIQSTIYAVHLSQPLKTEFDSRYEKLRTRSEVDFKNEPTQTYY